MSLAASLPMYAAPDGAREAFWAGLRDRLVVRGVAGVPDTLVEPDDLHAHWRSENLLFSQTCGRPFATVLKSKVALLAVPHYDAAGCEGPRYRSVFVVRERDRARRLADLPGRRAAINGADSHSGFSQLEATLAPFSGENLVAPRPIVSGGHLASLALVQDGAADFAAIDCVTWALAVRDQPSAVRGLRIVGRSPTSLGLPFIASERLPAATLAALRDALAETMRDPALATVRQALLLGGVSPVAPEDYLGHAELALRSSALPGDLDVEADSLAKTL